MKKIFNLTAVALLLIAPAMFSSRISFAQQLQQQQQCGQQQYTEFGSVRESVYRECMRKLSTDEFACLTRGDSCLQVNERIAIEKFATCTFQWDASNDNYRYRFEISQGEFLGLIQKLKDLGLGHPRTRDELAAQFSLLRAQALPEVSKIGINFNCGQKTRFPN